MNIIGILRKDKNDYLTINFDKKYKNLLYNGKNEDLTFRIKSLIDELTEILNEAVERED